ncbi:MAG: LLM class F420-dependent oxidoreductase [Acidimicrobiia bacterium]
MEFGLPLFGLSPRYYPEVAKAAEENGFDSVWMPEHLVLPEEMPPTYPYTDNGFPPIVPETPMYDVWVVLASIASMTSTIRLATNVYILPLRNPFITARSVVTLDRISGGRVTLGIGVGWLEEEFDTVGESFHDRGKRTDEIMGLLRRLWTVEVIESKEGFYQFGPVRFAPKPLQKPCIPIQVGGHSKAALRRAGRLGDGWIAAGDKNLEMLAEMISVVNGARSEAGRMDQPFEITSSLASDYDSVQRVAELGVTRVTTGPKPTKQFLNDPGFKAQISKDDFLEHVKRFGDEVIAKVNR